MIMTCTREAELEIGLARKKNDIQLQAPGTHSQCLLTAFMVPRFFYCVMGNPGIRTVQSPIRRELAVSDFTTHSANPRRYVVCQDRPAPCMPYHSGLLLSSQNRQIETCRRTVGVSVGLTAEWTHNLTIPQVSNCGCVRLHHTFTDLE
jgi:hypothetical protein